MKILVLSIYVEVSNLKLVKRRHPMRNDGPDFFSKPVVIDLEVRYSRFFFELRAAAAEVMTSIALATEVHSAWVDNQRAI